MCNTAASHRGQSSCFGSTFRKGGMVRWPMVTYLLFLLHFKNGGADR